MKLSKSQIKKLDKLSKKKPIMVRVGHNWYNWYESEGNIVWLTTQSGDEKEFKYKEIDDIQESTMKITKTQLRKIIKEELQQLNEDKYIDLYSHVKLVQRHLNIFKSNIDAERGGSWDSDSVEYEKDRWEDNSKMLKSRDKKLGQWEKKVNKVLNDLIKDYKKAWR